MVFGKTRAEIGKIIPSLPIIFTTDNTMALNANSFIFQIFFVYFRFLTEEAIFSKVFTTYFTLRTFSRLKK